MKLKKVVQLPDAAITCRVVKVFFNNETDEYVCQLFISGGHYEPADYFTDDYDDAIGTAKVMCEAPKPETKASRFLADKKAWGISTPTIIDGANSMCVSRGKSGGVYHWVFADGSFLYFNSENNGWTI